MREGGLWNKKTPVKEHNRFSYSKLIAIFLALHQHQGPQCGLAALGRSPYRAFHKTTKDHCGSTAILPKGGVAMR